MLWQKVTFVRMGIAKELSKKGQSANLYLQPTATFATTFV
jgi:hypothetical protein